MDCAFNSPLAWSLGIVLYCRPWKYELNCSDQDDEMPIGCISACFLVVNIFLSVTTQEKGLK